MFFVDLIQALAWPAVAVYAIHVFREPAISLFERIRSARVFGVSIETPAEQQSAEEISDPAESIKEFMAIPETHLIREGEENIRNVLQERGHEVTTNLDKMLLRNLTDTFIQLGFERTYRYIFGNQIRLLKSLNTAGQQSRELMEKYFEGVKSQRADLKDWDLDQYLQFLFNETLIRLDGDVYGITIKGQEFLMWITRLRYSERLGEP